MKKLVFLGDICTDSYPKEVENKFKSTALYGYLSDKNNIVIGNLESPLLVSDIKENRNKFSLKNRPAYFSMYDFCYGFSLANNHVFDQGYDGFVDTCTYLDEKGKYYFGAGEDLNSARRPLIIECNDKKIGLLAYNCYSTNSEMIANKSSPGAAPLIFDIISQDVKRLIAGGIDHIFVLPHWGIENQLYPTLEQVGFARRLVDLGVDGIVGGHTHTIQAFEKYNYVPIAYSLGNFLFYDFAISPTETYFQSKYNKEGMILEFDFTKEHISVERKYIKFTSDMIPELCSVEDLISPVKLLDSRLLNLTGKLKHQKMKPELDILLRYNGSAMQLVYSSQPIDNNLNVTYESFKSKVKRITIKQIKRFL